MFKQRKKLWSVLIFLFVLLVIIAWGYLREKNKEINKYYVPELGGRVDPTPDTELFTFTNKASEDGLLFFPTELAQISGTGWQLRYFQPTLKGFVEKEDGMYLEVEFPDKANQLQTAFVFIGANFEGKNYNIVYKHENNKFGTFQSFDEVKSYFKTGQRLRIEYLSFVEGLEQGLKSNACQIKSTTCDAAYYVNQHQQEFIEFSKNGTISDDLSIIAISLDKTLK